MVMKIAAPEMQEPSAKFSLNCLQDFPACKKAKATAVATPLKPVIPAAAMGKEVMKLKTRVIKKNLNPEWNEELTLSVEDPNLLVKLYVYDKDLFSFDDPMGNAEFEIRTIFEVAKKNLEGFVDGTVITKVVPNRQNCLAEESVIRVENGKVYQDMFLRLKNVESGEIELQLQWIYIPNAKGFQDS
ncbi:GTPase activating protein 1-like [Phalaenopsis equestris]|uniref:GTPase activating protein 1-like n=1 Tax=Phalaenopsis equestris TaxID=78828 RepID=UPI0009E36400|nr:GTPase activating protein 1-like [Phalaenopsis equestris]